MKTLVRTGKVIKINPSELLSLYKYIKYYMRWEPEDIIKKLNEIYPYRRQKEYSKRVKFLDEKNVEKGVVINIPVSFVILPSVLHNEVTRFYGDIIKTKRLDEVSIDELSHFNVYQVINSFIEGKFSEINLSVSIGLHRIDQNYAIRSLWIDLRDRYLSRSYKQPLIEATVFDILPDENIVERFINFVRQNEGAKYSRLPQEVVYGVKWVEENLTLTLNLFHTLHSHDFEKDDIMGFLFKEYSETVKGFGCEFEEALLSAAGVISAFLF